ncbi:hypothetical protein GR160_08995 [Flavobacterium sp. Sd200]|uniref:hypothetical protein n=1 Tax=Flavobacterium sp. Sd200 TaxID=2692211 RepID=UPI0013684E88|nr:hypothetical protein [Flavobacterium sp. Sd200]MXN91364.1 hypothetical protein [Flavobacterium sp. Sd200]
MKRLISRILIMFSALILVAGCSLNDDGNNDFVIQFIPIEEVTTPQYVTPGQTYPITMYYRKPNDCYYVSEEPYYEIWGSTRTVAIQAILLERATCNTIDYTAPESKTINFVCPLTAERNILFKFFKGNDAQGNQQYIEVTVPVQQ